MIVLINRLISLLPNPTERVYQNRWMYFRGIKPLPAWTVTWFDDLLHHVQGRRR